MCNSSTKGSLKTHKRSNLKCDSCDKNFKRKDKLKEHMKAEYREFTLKLYTICFENWQRTKTRNVTLEQSMKD